MAKPPEIQDLKYATSHNFDGGRLADTSCLAHIPWVDETQSVELFFFGTTVFDFREACIFHAGYSTSQGSWYLIAATTQRVRYKPIRYNALMHRLGSTLHEEKG